MKEVLGSVQQEVPRDVFLAGEGLRLLRKWHEGDAAANDKLIPLVYAELRRIARRHMTREQPGRTMPAVAGIG